MLERRNKPWTLQELRTERADFYKFLNAMGMNRRERKRCGFYPSKWWQIVKK